MSRPVRPGCVSWDCPGCRKPFDLPQAWVGQVVECPLCRFKFAALRDTPGADASPLVLEEARPPFSRRALLVGVLVPLALLVAIVLALVFGRSSGAGMPAPDEQMLRDYILGNTENKASVQIVTWGPHFSREECADYKRRHPGPINQFGPDQMPPDAVYRVVFRARDPRGELRTMDMLFIVYGHRVKEIGQNANGERWKEFSPLGQ